MSYKPKQNRYLKILRQRSLIITQMKKLIKLIRVIIRSSCYKTWQPIPTLLPIGICNFTIIRRMISVSLIQVKWSIRPKLFTKTSMNMNGNQICLMQPINLELLNKHLRVVEEVLQGYRIKEKAHKIVLNCIVWILAKPIKITFGNKQNNNL